MKNRRYAKSVKLDRGEVTPQGFLRAPAFLTRVGVFRYRKKDGTIVRELRHPDDVFHEDSLATLKMCPVTNDHPHDFVSPENMKSLTVGWIADTIKIVDNRMIGAEAIVADKEALAMVDAGKVELSCGYHADVIEEKGTYDGEPYDCRQTNIRYNHVAIVDRGRAGPGVRLRLDSEDAVDVDSDESEGEPKMKFKIGDKEFDLDKEVADAINAEFKSRDDAFEAFKKKAAKEKGDAADVEAAIEKATKELKSQADKLQAKCDSLEEKLAAKKDGASAAEVSKLVKERARVEKVAATVLGAEAAAKLDDKSDLDVMKEVIVKASPKTDLKDKSEDYIRARFDSIAEENEGREERRNQFSTKTDSRKEEEFDSTAARKRNIDSDKDLWQKPLATSKK